VPTMSGRVTIATGATVNNVALGSQYELAPFHGKLEVGLFADKNLVDCAIFAGPDTLQEPGGMVPFGAAEATPRSPDDYHWEDMVAKGDRIKITLHNANAGTATVNWAARFTPMA
jgi:hypothetical protein